LGSSFWPADREGGEHAYLLSLCLGCHGLPPDLAQRPLRRRPTTTVREHLVGWLAAFCQKHIFRWQWATSCLPPVLLRHVPPGPAPHPALARRCLWDPMETSHWPELILVLPASSVLASSFMNSPRTIAQARLHLRVRTEWLAHCRLPEPSEQISCS
jgi:hypothetical protein